MNSLGALRRLAADLGGRGVGTLGERRPDEMLARGCAAVGRQEPDVG